MTISQPESDAEVAACFSVMSQLRPQLSADEFVSRVRRQRNDGYRLACIRDGDAVVAVAGFRITDCLAWGKHLYVDDLVTDEARRSEGHGRTLLDWLIAYAKQHGCEQFHLDSGVQRFAAHRFYLRHGLDITSHHFAMKLPPV